MNKLLIWVAEQAILFWWLLEELRIPLETESMGSSEQVITKTNLNRFKLNLKDVLVWWPLDNIIRFIWLMDIFMQQETIQLDSWESEMERITS